MVATVILCQRGKIGSTTYYLGMMRAGDLIRSVGFARELPGWEGLSIEERIQRELDDTRVRNEIVPYWQNDPDRFFGALIVDIYQGWENMEFEPLKDVCKGLPSVYRKDLQDFGFLTLPGAEYLIALDGQHRLKALNYAIKGDESGEIKPRPDLVDDNIAVIFVPHEDHQKIRNIFNKVNRYAKQTSRGDNIITAEDDACAIIARRLIRDGQGVLSPDLVNWKSNTLAKRSKQFTTISAVYETVQVILEHHPKMQAHMKSKAKMRPTDEELNQYYLEVAEVWDTVLNGVDEYADLSSEVVQAKREVSLLFKPVGQIAMFRGLVTAMRQGRMELEEAVEQLNNIDWRIDADVWRDILVKPSGAMIARQEAKEMAGQVIAYMIAGDRLGTKYVNEMAAKYARMRGDSDAGVDDILEQLSLPL